MIVVTGATGNVGTRLVEMLSRTGHPVTAVARTVSSKPDHCRADFKAADLAEPETLKAILDGADSLFLICAGENPQAIIDLAAAAGVSQVVLLSSQGAGTRPDSYPHPCSFEEAVTASSLRWTVLRPSGFATNTLRWAPAIRTNRIVTAPYGGVGLPVIDPADIASFAAATLTQPNHDSRVYRLTGPELISPRQQVDAISEALETPLDFVEQSRDAAAAQMRQFMPAHVVESTLDILGQPLDEERRISTVVPDILGRPAHSFSEWAKANVDAFR